MTPDRLAEVLEALADGPPWDTAWLRSLLPELAVRGWLVAQQKEEGEWICKPLAEVVRSKSGNSKIIKGKQSAVPAPGLVQGYSASGPDIWVKESEHTGDGIVVSAVGARCGKAFRATGEWTAIANTHAILPSAAVDVDWLLLLLNNEDYWEKSGSAQPFVKVKATLLRKQPLPPLAEQHRIVAKVDELMGHAAVVEERHLAATSARVRFRDAALHALAEAEDHKAVETAWSRIEDLFDDLFTEPDDIQPLRQTILQLAVRGHLVAQQEGDEALRPIQDLFKSISTSGHKIKTSQIEKSGPVPVVDQGRGLIAGYTGRRDLAIKVDDPVLVFGDHTRAIKFIDFDFVAGADGTKILRPVGVDTRYLYVSIQAADIDSRGYGRHFKILKATEIRVPPLTEQHRIVAKVDELMGLCDTLEASLTRAKTTREQFAASISHSLTAPAVSAT